MEGVTAAAQEFLSDTAAVEAFLEVDRRREPALRELHDAFVAFRDEDESIARLVRRIKQPLWEVHTARGGAPQNLWGFQNEDERLFPERFAGAAPRFPDVDLASLFRSYLQDDPRRRDEQRIQLLLAFGEFVASIDAKGGEGEPRLGVGPAANFLTFAWHCLSMGAEPVFLYTANRAVKALDEAMGSNDAPGAHLERRFRTFFAVARRLGDGLNVTPSAMRRGWAVEHALEWILDRFERTGNMKALLEDPGASGLFRRRQEPSSGDTRSRPVIMAPSAGPSGGAGGVRIERPRIVMSSADATLEAPRPELEPARVEAPAADLAPGTDPDGKRFKTERIGEDDTRARQRARIGELSKKRTVSYGDAAQMIEKSGVDFADAVPPDRTPPVGMPRPEHRPDEAPTARLELAKVESARAAKAEAERAEAEKAEAARAAKAEAEKAEAARAAKAEAEKAEQQRPRLEPAKAPDAKRSVEPWWAEGFSPAPQPGEGVVAHGDSTEELDTPLKKRTPELKFEPKPEPKPEPRKLPDFRPSTEPRRAPEPPRRPVEAKAVEVQPIAVVRAKAPVVEPPSAIASLDDDSNDMATDDLLRELRGEVVQASRGEPTRATPPDRLARDLFLDPTVTSEIHATLEQRGRVLLVGPPWSGKTHVARRLAIHLAGHLDRVLLLRVHPELSYADLMGREPGLVRGFCERARDDREQRYVLVVDELDRGDAARALGELTGALSERGHDVYLGSTGATFHVPRNLLVIATARQYPTDPALVARFPAITLAADPEVLRRYLAQCKPAFEWVADLLRTINERLESKRCPVRIGHGVFMDPDLDADRLKLIFRHEVGPLLHAHGIERDALDLDALRRDA